MKTKQTIYFITGVSGAGKSTMVPLLRKKLSNKKFAIHDFDEQGVPIKANTKWRQKKTKEWLLVGYKNAKIGISTIISGITIPSEVLNALDRRRSIKIAFCFLNHFNRHIKERLLKRFENKQKIKELKKIFNITPTEFIKNNLKFATKIRKIAKDNKAYIINTTADTPHRTANKIITWIHK